MSAAVRIQFDDWDNAEHAAAAHLWPEFQRAETVGIISSRWFTRKAPCWRLRCQQAPAALPTDMKAHVARALDQMHPAPLPRRHTGACARSGQSCGGS
jgi:hypothetical protein